MSNSSRLHTINLPWRRFRAALPAVALISSGIVFAAQAAPAFDTHNGAVSSNSPVVVVPDVAMTVPIDPSPVGTPPSGPAAPVAPALVLPAGTVPGSSAPVPMDSAGIPVRALEAYRAAATLVNAADPGCHLDWALIAAIGRVESNHGRFGGNQLDNSGVAQPGIFGIPLDGSNGTARITDTDGGRLDRDSLFDRAVGPMQFIPGTWTSMGVDANGDGVKNPQDMTDAATSTAIYLCSGPGDLRLPGDLTAAIMRYNASDSYVKTVTAIADAYRHGVSAIPASDLPAAKVASLAVPMGPVAPATAARGAMGASGTPTSATLGASGTPTTAAAPGTLAATGASVTTTTDPTITMSTVAPDTTTSTSTVVPDPTTVVPTTVDPTVVPTTVDPTVVPTTVVPTTVVPTPTTVVPTTTVPDPCLVVDPTIPAPTTCPPPPTTVP